MRGRGSDGAFGLLICDAAYTPRHYAEPGSDKAPLRAGSDVLAWHDAVRPIRSLHPRNECLPVITPKSFTPDRRCCRALLVPSLTGRNNRVHALHRPRRGVHAA